MPRASCIPRWVKCVWIWWLDTHLLLACPNQTGQNCAAPLLCRHECFTGKYTTRKIHTKLHPGLEWRILWGYIDDITDINLSLEFCLNSLVYDRRILGSSSKVLGNLRKFSENAWERSSGLRSNFGKSSEIFGKCSETFRKSSLCLCNKKNTNLEDMNFMFSWQEQIFSSSFCYMQELLW